jgi:hypothetical protein
MIATNIDCPAGYEHFWDIDPYRGLWAAVCPHCGSGKEMNWEQMKDYELWYKLILREEEVWAWNSSHLAFIIQKLEKKVDKAHPWAYFEAYLKKSWLVKLSQEQYVKKLKALLYKETRLAHAHRRHRTGRCRHRLVCHR